MNKYGKGNAIFIILIPVFAIFGLILVDTIIGYNQEKNYKKFSLDVIRDVMTNEEMSYDEYYDEIKRIYEFNGYETDNLVVDANEYQVYVENEHLYYGLFSSLFGNGKEELVKLFGLIDFKLKKSSRVFVKIEASYNYNDELEFKYVE